MTKVLITLFQHIRRAAKESSPTPVESIDMVLYVAINIIAYGLIILGVAAVWWGVIKVIEIIL